MPLKLHFMACEQPFVSLFFLLQWRHNGRQWVSNHQSLECEFNFCAGVDQRKYQSSTSLAFVRVIHRSQVNSPHKGPVTRKRFHLMTPSFINCISIICIDSLLGKPPSWEGGVSHQGAGQHDDVIKRKHFRRYWPTVKGIDLFHNITTNFRFYSNFSQILPIYKTRGYYNQFDCAKSFGVCYWCAQILQCGYMVQGLTYIAFYVQKHISARLVLS